MNVFELFAKISLDTTDYKEKLSEAAKKGEDVKTKLQGLGKAVGNAGKTFAKLGAGVGAASAGVFAFANKVTQNADNIDKMSQKLGISAEAYQEWDFILTHCGASVEGLQTSMKTLANAAADGSNSTTAAFEKLGLSMDDVAGMSQEDLFSTVITRLQDMGESTERTAIAADLLGRSATELGPLFNTTSEDTEKMRQQVHELGGVMSNEAVKNGAAFQDSLTNLKSSFSGVANGLASELIPKLTTLMDKFSEWVGNGGLEKVLNIFKKLAPAIAAVGTAIVAAKIATAISGIVKAFSTLGGVLKTAKLAMTAFNAVLAANPIGAVVAVVAALVAGFIALYKNSETFRDAIKKVGEFFKGVFENAVEIVKGFIGFWVEGFNSIGETAGEILDSIKQFFANAWENIKQGWSVIVDFFSGLWEGIKNVFSVVGETLSGFFSDAWEGIKGVWNAVVGFFEGVWNGIKEVFNAVVGFIKGIFETEWNGIKNIWNGVTGFFSGVWEGIKGVFSGVKDTLGGFFSDAWDAITGAFDSVTEFFGGIWDDIKNAFDIDAALDWGKDLIQNFIDGIKSMWESLKNAVSDAAGVVKDFLGFSEPKKGPLSNFHTYAPDMMDLFASGIKDNAYVVQNQLNKSLNFDIPAQNVDFASSGLGGLTYSTAQAASAGGAEGGVKQPVTIIVQLASGLEIARQMVDDINQLSRINGAPVI